MKVDFCNNDWPGMEEGLLHKYPGCFQSFETILVRCRKVQHQICSSL